MSVITEAVKRNTLESAMDSTRNNKICCARCKFIIATSKTLVLLIIKIIRVVGCCLLDAVNCVNKKKLKKNYDDLKLFSKLFEIGLIGILKPTKAWQKFEDLINSEEETPVRDMPAYLSCQFNNLVENSNEKLPPQGISEKNRIMEIVEGFLESVDGDIDGLLNLYKEKICKLRRALQDENEIVAEIDIINEMLHKSITRSGISYEQQQREEKRESTQEEIQIREKLGKLRRAELMHRERELQDSRRLYPPMWQELVEAQKIVHYIETHHIDTQV